MSSAKVDFLAEGASDATEVLSWKYNLERGEKQSTFVFLSWAWEIKAVTPIFSTLIVALLHTAQIASLAFLPGLSQSLNCSSDSHLFWKTVFPC